MPTEQDLIEQIERARVSIEFNGAYVSKMSAGKVLPEKESEYQVQFGTPQISYRDKNANNEPVDVLRKFALDFCQNLEKEALAINPGASNTKVVMQSLEDQLDLEFEKQVTAVLQGGSVGADDKAVFLAEVKSKLNNTAKNELHAAFDKLRSQVAVPDEKSASQEEKDKYNNTTANFAKLESVKIQAFQAELNKKFQEELQRLARALQSQAHNDCCTLHGGMGDWSRRDLKSDEIIEPGAGLGSVKLGQLENGLYNRNPSKFNFRVKDGVITVQDENGKPANSKQGYGEAMDMLRRAGCKSVSIHYDKPESVNWKEVKMLIELAHSKGLRVDLGPAVLEAMENLKISRSGIIKQFFPWKLKENFGTRYGQPTQDEINAMLREANRGLLTMQDAEQGVLDKYNRDLLLSEMKETSGENISKLEKHTTALGSLVADLDGQQIDFTTALDGAKKEVMAQIQGLLSRTSEYPFTGDECAAIGECVGKMKVLNDKLDESDQKKQMQQFCDGAMKFAVDFPKQIREMNLSEGMYDLARQTLRDEANSEVDALLGQYVDAQKKAGAPIDQASLASHLEANLPDHFIKDGDRAKICNELAAKSFENYANELMPSIQQKWAASLDAKQEQKVSQVHLEQDSKSSQSRSADPSQVIVEPDSQKRSQSISSERDEALGGFEVDPEDLENKTIEEIKTIYRDAGPQFELKEDTPLKNIIEIAMSNFSELPPEKQREAVPHLQAGIEQLKAKDDQNNEILENWSQQLEGNAKREHKMG